MADAGAAAAAAGMDVVPGTSDLRKGYDEINKSRDYLAAHMTTGTHDASAIATGTLDPARIPTLDGATKITGTVPNAGYAGSAGYASSAGSVTEATHADGPSSAAYGRGASGGGWFTVWMNSALQFMRNTSSRRYKKNIRDWAGTSRRLRTVIFDRRGNDTPNDEVGFIAEEVLKSLPEAVVYFDGKVDGINDRVILAAMLCDLQDALTRIEQLEGGN